VVADMAISSFLRRGHDVWTLDLLIAERVPTSRSRAKSRRFHGKSCT
jgi:hypothetical protein